MKLIIATGLYPPDIGGPATYVKMLEDELPRHGISVRIVSFGSVRRLPFGIRHFLYFVKLIRGSFHVDLIYAQDAVSVGIAATLVSLLLTKPLWVRVPGHHEWEQAVQRFGVTSTLDEYVQSPAGHLFLRFMRLWVRFVFFKAERVIVPSQYMARILTATGVSREKIVCMYSSVKKLDVEGTKVELREHLHLSGRVIVSAGRLVPWKGFEELISTFRRLKKDLPDAQLIIVGEGPLMQKLIEHARTEGVHDSVRFTGSLPQQELFTYVKAADVFALNTAYEGLSHQLIEVMTLGIPIVTTSVGGNPELISNKEEGLLVSYNDSRALLGALKVLLEDPVMGAKLAEKAKERSSQFMSEDAVSQLCTVFRESGFERGSPSSL